MHRGAQEAQVEIAAVWAALAMQRARVGREESAVEIAAAWAAENGR
jgi:hypothetical protein